VRKSYIYNILFFSTEYQSMSKKKQHGGKPQNQPLEVLQQEAEALAAKGNDRDAIERYKQLLKREQRPEWLAALAQAYLRRGRELAAKGMYKEASVMWENRASACHDSSELATYLEWLLKAGRYGRAVRLYQDNQAELGQAAKKLPALIGALLLSGATPALRRELAGQGQWEEQTALAERALEAYCRGAPAAELETLLKQIPFRSPFRDLRGLLKALAMLESDPAEATRLAAGIPSDSPYANLARLLPKARVSVAAPEDASARPLPGQEAFVSALYGWNAAQVKAFQALMEAVEGAEVFGLVLKHRQALGEDYARQTCRQWIPRLSPRALDAFKRVFPLNGREEIAIRALAVENLDEPEEAVLFWAAALKELEPHLDDPDKRSEAALIQRHRVGLLRHIHDDDLARLEGPLQQCIKWNPEDKPSWLELIRLYRDDPESKKSYADWVGKAVAQFPRDVDILLAAVEAASQRKAFKKAAGYAQTVLKIDPVNARARAVLIESHLGHARKQFKAGKYELAAKELDNAGRYERGDPSPVLRINQACLAYLQGQRDKARAFLENAVLAADSAIGGHALIFLESQQAGIPPAELSGVFAGKSQALLPGWPKNHLPGPAELARLPRLLASYQSQRELSKLFQSWRELLKKAADQNFVRDELIGLCEFFKQAGQYDLLQDYARHGARRWEQMPLLVFYEIYGELRGESKWLSDRIEHRLQQAHEKAKEQNDHRTAGLISNFLHARFQLPFFGEADDEDDEYEYEYDDDDFVLPDLQAIKARIERLKALPEEQLLRILFNGRMPSEREIKKLTPDILTIRLLKYAMQMDDEEDGESGGLPFPFPFPGKPRRK
jgi:cellulose synthase operon protein C